jgi:hypothetical protein
MIKAFYYKDPDQLFFQNEFAFRVPQLLRSRDEIFEAYAKGLCAPGSYFGENWDAFADCLMDLQWIETRTLNIVHSDVPSISQDELRIYLDILSTSKSKWESEETREMAIEYPDFRVHELNIWFDEKSKGLIK